MRAFCALETGLGLEIQRGLALRMKRGSWDPNSRFPGPAKPREGRAQIHSLHSFSTPAKTQRAFAAGLLCSYFGPTFLPPSSILPTARRAPFFPQLLEPHRVVPETRSLRLPHALPPRATGTGRSSKRSPRLRLRLRFEATPRPNPAPLGGTRTVGYGWGGMPSWGKVSAFKEGGRPATGTSPTPESFPSGAIECARGWRGGREGVG